MTERPDLEKLLALRAEATQGKWFSKNAESNGTYGIEWIDATEGRPQFEGGYSNIADFTEIRFWKNRLPENVSPEIRKANAALIVELVNALPAIADYVRELEKMVQAYKEG